MKNQVGADKKLPLFFLFAFLCLSPLYAHASLEELVGSRTEALLAGESPVEVQFGSSLPRLIPAHDLLRRQIDSERQSLNPGVMVEILYLYRKPPSAESSGWTPEEKLRLFNELIALGTMAGLEYFSSSRGSMRTLYEISQIIDSPSARRPIPTPVFRQLPQELSLYVRQVDLSFGDNIYRFDFRTTPGALIVSQQNITPLSIGIIRAVGRNNLRSTIAILDAGPYILVYATAMARAASVPGMRERVGNSFRTRTEAIIQWFSERADMAFTGS